MGQASGITSTSGDLAAAHLAALGRFNALPAPALPYRAKKRTVAMHDKIANFAT